ncbi:hypothetical protein GQ600_6607 [Phytophthora cactorum]|nr:hypothetical protein GQ600_6607 [Phytophthora cactorum]
MDIWSGEMATSVSNEGCQVGNGPSCSAPEAAPPALPGTSAPMNPAPAPVGRPDDDVDASIPDRDSSSPSPASRLASSSHRCAAQRHLNSAVGFDDVLAAVQPLSDSLPDLPRRIGELEARLRSAEADAAAAKRSVVPQMLARENAEQLLKISSSKVESLEAENRRLRATNLRVDALLQKMKESTGLHTQHLEFARAEVAERDAVILALERRLANVQSCCRCQHRANSPASCHSDQGSEGQVCRCRHRAIARRPPEANTHLLHIKRVLRSHMSLAGMDPEILVLAVQGTGRLLMPPPIVHLLTRGRGFVGSSRCTSSSGEGRSPSRSRKLHKRIRPGGEDSDNDLGVDPDSSSEDKPPIPTDQTSSAMSAAGLGDGATAEYSSPKSGRRGLHKPKAWKQKKRQKTRPGSQSSVRFRSSQSSRRTSPRSQSRSRSPYPTKSSTGRPRSRSQSESSKRATPVSSPPSSVQASPSASKVLKDDRSPELIDLTSDVKMSSSPEDSPPTVLEAPAPVAEASSVTKKIPDSGPPSSPLPKAPPSAVPGDEDEGTTFHDLVALFGSDDDNEDQSHSAQASSLSGHPGVLNWKR